MMGPVRPSSTYSSHALTQQCSPRGSRRATSPSFWTRGGADMAVVALASASGSPGVTTTALGMALLWPRPVLLVEADPTGGSGLLAGYFRGTTEYVSGMIELALTSTSIGDALADVARPIEGTQVSYIAGTRSHAQAGALRDLWPLLAEALADLESTGQDVIVDAGASDS